MNQVTQELLNIVQHSLNSTYRKIIALQCVTISTSPLTMPCLFINYSGILEFRDSQLPLLFRTTFSLKKLTGEQNIRESSEQMLSRLNICHSEGAGPHPGHDSYVFLCYFSSHCAGFEPKPLSSMGCQLKC